MTKQKTAPERYYTIIDPKELHAAILSQHAQRSERYPAELKAIAASGAVLLLASPPELQGDCRLSIASRKLPEPLDVTVRVDWLRPNPAGDWKLGCAFTPPLSETTFKTLLNSGLLERRSSAREPARIPVEIQLLPAKTRVPAIVRNFSEGGVCCLTANCSPEKTRRVNMFAMVGDEEAQIPLKVRWYTQAGTEYFIGCQFVSSSDFALLRTLQQEQLDGRGGQEDPIGSAAATVD